MKLKNTIPRRKWKQLGWLMLAAVLLVIAGLFPAMIERFYSTGLYLVIAATLRMITGWIPFSLGDIGYLLVFIWLIIKIIKAIQLLQRPEGKSAFPIIFAYRLLHFFLWAFIIFKLAWGFNYDRLGIAWQLGIDKRAYTREEITALTNELIDKVNACRRELKDGLLPQPSLSLVYAGAYQAYAAAEKKHPFLQYRHRSVKASLYTFISDYMGFSGYYNPFSGEAQVRTDVPRVLVPYITCHEMAHQLGYASESEANFVGYLAASSSADPFFRYSVYLDLFSYAQSEEIFLYSREKNFRSFDSLIKQNRTRLDTLVKKDRREIREFFAKRRNRISPAVNNLYDQYLKLNKQSQGIKSYDEVLGWMVGYRRKLGGI